MKELRITNEVDIMRFRFVTLSEIAMCCLKNPEERSTLYGSGNGIEAEAGREKRRTNQTEKQLRIRFFFIFRSEQGIEIVTDPFAALSLAIGFKRLELKN
jgi:hypothetical protein